MECRRCAACDRAFRPRAQVPHQRYCGLAACQRERRRRWQQSKLRSDADYRANQRQAQRAWADGHGEYWREYRARHPDYTDHNRLEQRQRDRCRRVARLGLNLYGDFSVKRISSCAFLISLGINCAHSRAEARLRGARRG